MKSIKALHSLRVEIVHDSVPHSIQDFFGIDDILPEPAEAPRSECDISRRACHSLFRKILETESSMLDKDPAPNLQAPLKVASTTAKRRESGDMIPSKNSDRFTTSLNRIDTSTALSTADSSSQTMEEVINGDLEEHLSTQYSASMSPDQLTQSSGSAKVFSALNANPPDGDLAPTTHSLHVTSHHLCAPMDQKTQGACDDDQKRSLHRTLYAFLLGTIMGAILTYSYVLYFLHKQGLGSEEQNSNDNMFVP